MWSGSTRRSRTWRRCFETRFAGLHSSSPQQTRRNNPCTGMVGLELLLSMRNILEGPLVCPVFGILPSGDVTLVSGFSGERESNTLTTGQHACILRLICKLIYARCSQLTCRIYWRSGRGNVQEEPMKGGEDRNEYLSIGTGRDCAQCNLLIENLNVLVYVANKLGKVNCICRNSYHMQRGFSTR
jgi:hypothetical protein